MGGRPSGPGGSQDLGAGTQWPGVGWPQGSESLCENHSPPGMAHLGISSPGRKAIPPAYWPRPMEPQVAA